MPDNGESLWYRSFLDISKTTCKIQDVKAVKNITRPCSIVLKDVVAPAYRVTHHNTLAEPMDCKQQAVSDGPKTVSKDHSGSTDTNTQIIPSYTPMGLANPSNHCYVNSTLQVLYRAVFSISVTNQTTFSNNQEGDFAKAFLGCQDLGSSLSVQDLKTLLQAFNHFFDGTQQRDALECLLRILDILHEGTKTNFLGLGENILDGSLADDMETSLCRDYFTYTTKQTMVCDFCSSSTITYSQDNTLHVYPSLKCNLSQIIENSLSDSVMKNCIHCMQNSMHSMTRQITQSPRILFVIVSRYDFSLTARKNKGKVKVHRQVTINSFTYNLIAAIHHHGEETTSGHYTARSFYSDASYFLNDQLVRNLKDDNYISDSVYILLYECV